MPRIFAFAREKTGLSLTVGTKKKKHFHWSDDQTGFVIDPNSLKKLIWDCVVFALIIYLAIAVPLDLALDTEPLDAANSFFWWNRIIDLFFITDVIITFFTAIEEKITGDIVTDKKLRWQFLFLFSNNIHSNIGTHVYFCKIVFG